MSKYPSAGYALGPSQVKRVRHAHMDASIKKLSLRERIGNWLLRKSDNDSVYHEESIQADTTINSDGMRFNLYKASGGFVIETRMYDDRTDRHTNKLHIITDDQDLGEQIGKIITMESLR